MKKAIKKSHSLAPLIKKAEKLREKQQYEEALQVLTQSLKVEQSSTAWAWVGRIYRDLTAYGDAIKAFEEAVKLDQNNHEIWADIAITYFQYKKYEHAILIMDKAIELAEKASADDARLYRHFLSVIFKTYPAPVFNEQIKTILLNGLTAKSLIHDNFVPAWNALLKRDKKLALSVFPFAKTDFKDFAAYLNKNEIPTFANDPFFIEGIKTLKIRSTELEDFLRNLRHYFLQSLMDKTIQKYFTTLIYALAEQCFFNEYVFSETDNEKELIAKLTEEIESTLLTTINNLPEKLAVLGCYAPLNNLKNTSEIASYCRQELADNHELIRLIKTQIEEPLEEKDLEISLTTTGDIKNEISEKVRDQYEENPYPRWKDYAIVKGKEKFENSPAVDIQNCKSYLIAGCGTGKQIAKIQTNFLDAHITAIDLSRTSLAYAMRKCCELSIDNVEFHHADILELGKLGKEFDVISCNGVLHHMEQPIEGWKVLRDILKPGGYMHIGLYSKSARQYITKAQEHIRQKGYASTSEGIRAAREDIKMLTSEPIHQATKSSDFYTLSTCRDLLFHVQEHLYTIPKIQEELEILGLEFSSMSLDSASHKRYIRTYPDDPKIANLENLHAFEEKHPFTFGRMYQFWVRKPL